MNYIINKNRAILSADASEKSLYIYINQRTLRRAAEQAAEGWYNISDEVVVEIEDETMVILEQGE